MSTVRIKNFSMKARVYKEAFDDLGSGGLMDLREARIGSHPKKVSFVFVVIFVPLD